MKKSILFWCLNLLAGLPLLASAQWQHIGNADYNWGPFLVYRLSLATETGTYQENQRPLMLSFTYDKQIEGKNFAVTLIKEMEKLNQIQGDNEAWLKQLQRIFPDFSPKDRLSYIALQDKGYFVLNDTVLDYEFSPAFSQSLISIWLSPQTHFPKIKSQLLGETNAQSPVTAPDLKVIPEDIPLNEENINPQLPPEYPLEKIEEGVS